jgi:hypothetical protein
MFHYSMKLNSVTDNWPEGVTVRMNYSTLVGNPDQETAKLGLVPQ